jgi:hypothetical protein
MIATFPNTTQSEQAEIRRIQVAGTKSVSMLLRAEALFELTFAVTAYHYLHGTWLIFAVLFLLPDVSMAGYLVNARIGAHAYNLIHTYVAPSFLALAGFVLAIPLLYSLALIWAAHIGFDRSLGYGLKYSVAFGATHLGWKGPPGSVIGSQP